MRLAIVFAAALAAGVSASPGPAVAQQQQAGNAASANADETFQKLIDMCDDTDVLVLRARIRLQIPRATPAAAETAQTMMDQGLARCGEGDIAAAKTTLTEALAIADAGVTEKFGQDGTATVTAAKPPAAARAATEQAEKKDPWWKVW